MNYELLIFILQIGTFLIGLYLVFFKSYLSEKGKNLATQEDIEKITILVEQAKQQFTHDLEMLRTKLSLYNESFKSIKVLERNALITMNSAYSEWINALVTFSLANYSYDDYESLKIKHLLFDEKYHAFKVAEDNLYLYVHDEELRAIITNLHSPTISLQEAVVIDIITFMLNCKKYNDMRAIAPQEDQLTLNTQYHNLQQPLIAQSIQRSRQLYLTAYESQVTLIKALNHRIYELIKLQS